MSNQSWGKLLAETRDYLRDETTHIPTGFPSIDACLSRGGLRPGQVCQVIARSEVGKSSFASQVLVNMASGGVPSLYVSAEMTAPEVVTRMLSAAMRVSVAEVEAAIVGTDLHPRLLAANQWLKVVSVLDKPEPTWDDVSRVAAAAVHKPRVVVVDHLQLMGVGQYTKGADRVPTVTKAAKVYAKHHEVAVILLHQVARGAVSNTGEKVEQGQKNHGDQPLSSEDGFSGGEADADVLLGLYRPERRPGQSPDHYARWANIMVVQLLKNRHGPSMPAGVACRWELPTSMRIAEVAPLAEWLETRDVDALLGRT